MSSFKHLLAVSLLVLSAVVGFAQQGPLSLGQIEKLLAGGIGQERIASFVGDRGIDFEATVNTRARLRNVGAGPALMQTVDKASAAYVASRPAGSPPAKAGPDPERSKLEVEVKKLRDELKKAQEGKKTTPDSSITSAPGGLPPAATPPSQRTIVEQGRPADGNQASTGQSAGIEAVNSTGLKSQLEATNLNKSNTKSRPATETSLFKAPEMVRVVREIPAIVELPRYKVGDSWTVRLADGRTEGRRVSAVDNNGYVFEWGTNLLRYL
jgi:hypothetical protein